MMVVGMVMSKGCCQKIVQLSPSLSLFLPERLAEGEFIQGVLENEDAIHLIQYEPKK